ncbi:DUF456 domain-containing protein [Nocardia puris]|uniref:DUF456 domain-containing protein n=1 Tax=Nocardia puris TaxID=208602 RepID=A0A366DD56_9NOCA|nr:DUF456 domain-containing protein [Nocardia puris]MBF6211121.1 DUF456 domain-containing protein [Nocardia puris]MBF6364840.1 DUF456 domain-containing protein [Nocardia puris]MBF6458626.1 DUF456 domain-containing protein [Nocardia puris]RBO87875.1 hypothetical protein DFR74_110130 [Nocardia puris]
MSVWGEILVAVAIFVGILGIIVPILPGVILIFGAILVWAIVTGGTTAWVVFAVSTVFLVISGVIKYTWPGRKMKDAGVSNRAIFLGFVLGIIGFFVIPVVGLFVGFVLGVYLSELHRLRENRQAWVATKHALKGVGLSILIELFGALLATGVWIVGAFIA